MREQSLPISLNANMKSGFFMGIGFGLGQMSTSLFAATAGMKIFSRAAAGPSEIS